MAAEAQQLLSQNARTSSSSCSVNENLDSFVIASAASDVKDSETPTNDQDSFLFEHSSSASSSPSSCSSDPLECSPAPSEIPKSDSFTLEVEKQPQASSDDTHTASTTSSSPSSWWTCLRSSYSAYLPLPLTDSVGFLPAPEEATVLTGQQRGDEAPMQLPPALPCCGLGVGLSLFILGFLLPGLWTSGAFLYFFAPAISSDAREHLGLLACCFAELLATVSGSAHSVLHPLFHHHAHAGALHFPAFTFGGGWNHHQRGRH
eukprot:TRINITY_DN10134_c0_g1_i1.p1 TRINITY_DN10134_c0_g1~~TRINITY_DN10134_c0_g1_i1.p1  ORF type:complete len:269 (-),score=36.92 TRINITY_DN10134_c0_g1_i1:399-1181(-)